MKILLLTQVPSIFNRNLTPSHPIPAFQAQTFWLRALRELNHQPKVFRYSDSVLLPDNIYQSIDRALFTIGPTFYSHYRLFQNHHYNLWPTTQIRTEKIIHCIKEFKPEVVIASGGISHFTSRIFTSRYAHTPKFILLHGEDPLKSATTFARQNLHHYDTIVTNDPTHAAHWLKLGAKRAYCLPYSAIDPKVHRKYSLSSSQKKHLKSDVVFIGTLFPSRQRQILRLTNQNFTFHLYGFLPTKRLLPELKPYYKGQAFGLDAVKIYNASKIALNFVPDHMPVGGNMRTFEIPGSGALEFVDRVDPSWYTDRKEIVVFKPGNLINLINYYLSHPAKLSAITKAGYTRTHGQHTYKKRFKQLLSSL